MRAETNIYGELMPERRVKPHLPEIKNEHSVESKKFEQHVKEEIEWCFPLIDGTGKREETAKFFAKVIVEKCKEHGQINYVTLDRAYETLVNVKGAVGLKERKFIDEIIEKFQEFL